MEEIPVFKVIIDENDEMTGVDMISLVDEPAMEVNWLKMSKLQNLDFQANKDKKMLYGVFIMPDQKIERYDESLGGKYYVVFEKPEIEKIVKKFNKNNFNKNINFMHGDMMVEGYVVENFITSDKIKANFGFEVPEGAWVGSVYIENDEFWNDYVKTEMLRGFSIEIKSWLIETQMKKEKMNENKLLPNEIEEIRKSIEAATDTDVEEILNEVVKTINDLMPDNVYDELGNILKEDMTDEEMYDEIKEIVMASYTDYPQAASENAKVALRWAEENGWGDCGTPVGKRRANQLANGEPISEETIARMAAFERHRQNSDKALGDGCGRLMWQAWGGTEGVEWAQRKLREIRGEDFVSPTSGETKDDFMARCIPVVIGEGKSQDQAVAICINYWENK